MSATFDRAFSVAVLPPGTAQRNLLRAHLEAHDHLAVAMDRPDGAVTIVGSYAQRAEILAVVNELSATLGLLRIGE